MAFAWSSVSSSSFRPRLFSGFKALLKPQISCAHTKQLDQVLDPQTVSSPENSHLLRVSIIGIPNAGKSTLVNRLSSYNVCPVSKRSHTTRKNQNAIVLEDNKQIIFIDTPGLVNMKEKKKFSFPDEFTKGPEMAIQSADVIGVIHDVSNSLVRNELNQRILHILKMFPNKDSVLILNKVDALKTKQKLLNIVQCLTAGIVGGKPIPVLEPKGNEQPINKHNLFNKTKLKLKKGAELSKGSEETDQNLAPQTPDLVASKATEELKEQGWPHFQDVFMISALNGDGVELLKNYFACNAKPAPWQFNEEILTDMPPTDLVIQIVQSRLLEYLPQEIPYKLHPKVEYWEKLDSGIIRTVLCIKCPNERIAKRVIGNGGCNINLISSETEKTLVNLLRVPVDLFINVTYNKVDEAK